MDRDRKHCHAGAEQNAVYRNVKDEFDKNHGKQFDDKYPRYIQNEVDGNWKYGYAGAKSYPYNN